MAKLESMDALLADELRDLYDAEQQLTRALPKMAKAASSPELKDAFEEHLQITEQHISRLEEALEGLDVRAKGKKCVGMQGLIGEGQEHLEADGDDDVIDAALIASAQKIEHYEIAAYGTAREHAGCVGHSEIADLLQQTLDEERDADRLLSALAEDLINRRAASREMDDQESTEDEEEAEEELTKPASRAGSQGRSRRPRS
jgi:ferritin-like metal-binding protein YciE